MGNKKFSEIEKYKRAVRSFLKASEDWGDLPYDGFIHATSTGWDETCDNDVGDYLFGFDLTWAFRKEWQEPVTDQEIEAKFVEFVNEAIELRDEELEDIDPETNEDLERVLQLSKIIEELKFAIS